jgi:uncharacterized membrane protein (UPF0127 family)
MKNKKKVFFSFLTIVIFFLAGFFLIRHLPQPSIAQIPENIKYVEIGGQKIKVDLALTEAQQAQGLSGRLNLLPDTGMFFVFSAPGKPLFWMKDMNFPIDMIWITPDMKVDYIKKDALPELYPETYGPSVNDGVAEYVLETTAGFSDNANLQIGESVEFIYQ